MLLTAWSLIPKKSPASTRILTPVPTDSQSPTALLPLDFATAQVSVAQALQHEGIQVPGGEPPMYVLQLAPVPIGYAHMVLATGEQTYYLLAVTADSGTAKLLARADEVSTTRSFSSHTERRSRPTSQGVSLRLYG